MKVKEFSELRNDIRDNGITIKDVAIELNWPYQRLRHKLEGFSGMSSVESMAINETIKTLKEKAKGGK